MTIVTNVAADPRAAPAASWAAWTPAERESFFDAIARHRRAAWRVTFASRVINLAVALIVAVLMSPLFYGALALLLDLLNLAFPAPNLVPNIEHALDGAINAPEKMSIGQWVELGTLAALPGLVWMAFVLSALRRVLGLSMAFDTGELSARAPDPTVLAEQRFGNVVAEAMAMGCPVVITPEVGLSSLVAQTGSGVVSDGAPRAFAQAVCTLLKDPALRRQMSERGRRTARRDLSWQAAASRMEELYLEICGPGTARRSAA